MPQPAHWCVPPTFCSAPAGRANSSLSNPSEEEACETPQLSGLEFRMLMNLDGEIGHLNFHYEILQLFGLGMLAVKQWIHGAWHTFVMGSYFHATLEILFMKATPTKI